jgi:hypothetical protein
MLFVDIHNYYSPPNSTPSSNTAIYISAGTLCFAILSYFLEKIISNHSKKKEIIRAWYKAAFLDPSLVPVNQFFEDIKFLTYKHLAVFDMKKASLSATDFLRYKALVNSDFHKIKKKFYNETLLPVFHNYPKIAESASDFLYQVQDDFITLFGGNQIIEADFDQFINNLYIEKGKLMATFKKPLVI